MIKEVLLSNAWFQFAGFRGRPILGQRKKLTVPSASKRPLRLYIPAVRKAASLFSLWKSKTKRRMHANWRSPSINRVLLKNLMANTGKSPTINQVLLSKVLWIYSITSRPTKFVTNHYKKRDLVNINCSYQWQYVAIKVKVWRWPFFFPKSLSHKRSKEQRRPTTLFLKHILLP